MSWDPNDWQGRSKKNVEDGYVVGGIITALLIITGIVVSISSCI